MFAAEAQIPIRVVNTTIQFRRLGGTAFDPDYQNIHHRNETLFGFADLRRRVGASEEWRHAAPMMTLSSTFM
jgi:hypothetical protein